MKQPSATMVNVNVPLLVLRGPMLPPCCCCEHNRIHASVKVHGWRVGNEAMPARGASEYPCLARPNTLTHLRPLATLRRATLAATLASARCACASCAWATSNHLVVLSAKSLHEVETRGEERVVRWRRSVSVPRSTARKGEGRERAARLALHVVGLIVPASPSK